MASLPQQQQQQPQSSASAPTDLENGPPARTNSFSATSIDSQALLLSSPPADTATSPEATQQDSAVPTETQTTADDEPRRCWICFSDETEDDATTSEWRSPCPCALVAHEKCLLDWIADMEAPNARQRAGKSAGKILCPLCKSEIRLARPRSIVVEKVRALQAITKLAVLPTTFFIAGTATYTTLRWFGTNTVYRIFGPADAQNILRPLNNQSNTTSLIGYFRNNWHLDLGLPAIPVVLFLSRTRLADSFLPFMPLIFFAGGGGGEHDGSLLQFTWPPSAAFTIAALPYVRGIYYSLYDKFCLPYERRWLKEVQPRADAEEVIEAEAHGDNVAELEVDVDLLFEDWHGGGPADNNNAPENPPVPIARGPAAPALEADAAVPAAAEAAQDGAAPAPNVPQQPARPRRIRREGNIGMFVGGIFDSIVSVFLFPGLASVAGEVLKIALPKSWVALPTSGKPNGFLQNKWARSIVGGCLLVGLKDAVLLYAQYKIAQGHRRRKIVDYDGSKGNKKTYSR